MGFRTKDRVDVGSMAPDFTRPSQSGEMVNLRDFLGSKPVVLFFYPKDDTPGCTDLVEEASKGLLEDIRERHLSKRD